ncbi:Uncharacterized protein Fot_34258 [Forsythia ovata]|uniref:Uncharacterized protein n=1 Tax=Forsythia ovata TaxID=205694 RepID=A0ABD1SI56_9LAMI
MPVTRRGYKSGQASQKRSTQSGGRRFARNDYRCESNILNDELEDEHIDNVFPSENMYKSNNKVNNHRSGRASQHRFTESVGKGSVRGNYREANISNHEVEDGHMDGAFYPQDLSRSNKRAMGNRMLSTRVGYTYGRPSKRRSTHGGGTRDNNRHQEPNTPNDELGDEHIDDATRGNNRTRGPNRATPMPVDRSQRIEIGIEGDKQDKYIWSTTNNVNVYGAWKKTTKDRYNDMMNDAHNQAKCKSQSINPADWRGHGPPWIRVEHWDSLLNYWDTKKWKNNAKIAKENRLAQGCDGKMTKYTAGLVSFVTTKKGLTYYF